MRESCVQCANHNNNNKKKKSFWNRDERKQKNSSHLLDKWFCCREVLLFYSFLSVKYIQLFVYEKWCMYLFSTQFMERIYFVIQKCFHIFIIYLFFSRYSFVVVVVVGPPVLPFSHPERYPAERSVHDCWLHTIFFCLLFHPFSFHSSAYFTLCWCIAIGYRLINSGILLPSFVLIFDWFQQTEHFHYDEWASWTITIIILSSVGSFFICLIFNLWFIGWQKGNANTYTLCNNRWKKKRRKRETLIKSFVLSILSVFEQMNSSH